MSKPILYHYWRSSSSWRVRWALACKHIEFESVMVNLLANEQLTDSHRARNPIGHIPVLDIDGTQLSESVAIVEYLEERTPEPALYPRAPLDRARVRQLVELINSGVQPLQNLAVLKHHSESPEGQKAWAAHFNARGLQAYERLVQQFDAQRGTPSKFSYGDTLTFADICLVPQVYSARRFGVDLTPFPRVVAIEAAALATPYADAARPERQPGAPAA